MNQAGDRTANRPQPLPAPDPSAASSTPDNLLRHYAGVIRRRGRWIVLGLAAGLTAGFVSTLFMSKPKPVAVYYKATHTLVLNGSSNGGSSYSLADAALLVHGQTLLGKVAQKLHLSVNQLGSQVSAIQSTGGNALDVTAISPSAQQAVTLADTSALLLNAAAKQEAADQYRAAVDAANAQLDALTKQQNVLIKQINDNPDQKSLLTAQLNSVENQYSQTYSTLQSLGASAPLVSLSTLRSASPIAINARGYNYRLSQNINWSGQAPGTAQQATTEFNESSFSRPAQIGKTTRIALGGAAGLVLGASSAFLVEAWDDRVRRRERVEDLTGLPVLAEIPKLSREQVRTHSVPIVDMPTGRAAERYRAARTSVLFALQAFDTAGHVHDQETGLPATGLAAADAADRAPVVMVTSPSPSEGKSTSCASLAAAFADNGLRTLVVDGDFRRPAVARFLSPVPNLVDPDMPATTRIDNVDFIAAPRGVDTPADAVYRLRRAINQWQHDYDIVLLDTPPMLTTNDATDLLAAADAVVLVLRAGQTRTGPAERVASVLTRFRADVLGIVLNGCENADMDPYYAYGYGYGYTGKKGKGGYTGTGVFSPKNDPEYAAQQSAFDRTLPASPNGHVEANGHAAHDDGVVAERGATGDPTGTH